MNQLLLSEVIASAKRSKLFTALSERLNMSTGVVLAFCAFIYS